MLYCWCQLPVPNLHPYKSVPGRLMCTCMDQQLSEQDCCAAVGTAGQAPTRLSASLWATQKASPTLTPRSAASPVFLRACSIWFEHTRPCMDARLYSIPCHISELQRMGTALPVHV